MKKEKRSVMAMLGRWLGQFALASWEGSCLSPQPLTLRARETDGDVTGPCFLTRELWKDLRPVSRQGNLYEHKEISNPSQSFGSS
jgi:hypothetical protein